jgi:hypothetical protein
MRVFKVSESQYEWNTIRDEWNTIRDEWRSKTSHGRGSAWLSLGQHEGFVEPQGTTSCMYSTRHCNARLALIRRSVLLLLVFVVPFLTELGCHKSPSITFTQVPPNSLGGIDTSGVLSGHVSRFSPGDRIVLFALNDKWRIQPDVNNSATPIANDGSWRAQIHLGHEYAALLVQGNFSAKEAYENFPALGGPVLAVKTVPGTPTEIDRMDHSARTLRFGGQEWNDFFHVSEYGGKPHHYLPQNASVDDRGHLHLKIARLAEQWTCSEVNVARSLGYGTYRITFESPKALEPAVEFGFFTMDVRASHENYREMDFHVSRWGDTNSKNAEYVVQPYYLPANVHGFEIPPTLVTTTLRWSPGQAAFSTEAHGKQLAAWKFTAGVPSPVDGTMYLNLCAFGYAKNPLQHEVEFVVTDFSYLP